MFSGSRPQQSVPRTLFALGVLALTQTAVNGESKMGHLRVSDRDPRYLATPTIASRRLRPRP